MDSMTMETLLCRARPLIPVLTIDRVEDAVPLALSLLAGGLRVLEITLRTEAAMEAIQTVLIEVPQVTVGAGTVTRADQLRELDELGCHFCVSPGATTNLLRAGLVAGIPLLPAVATVSEMMAAMEFGYRCFKFFPAFANGGTAALKTIAGPFPEARFCPTGGITGDNFTDYLALPNVLCVGGSWIAPASAIASRDWQQIEEAAREVVRVATAEAPG